MASLKSIQAPGTVRPVGHYSQAIVHNGLVYVSGQVPTDLETGSHRAGIEVMCVAALAPAAKKTPKPSPR